MSKKALNVIGFVALLISLGAELFADWVDDKETEAMIEEKLEEHGLIDSKKNG